MPFMRAFATALVLALSAPASQAGHPPIHIIVIDKATTDALGPLPWPRDRHARLVRILCGADARAVALCFYYRDPGSGRGDKALASEMAKCGRVYISTGAADSPQSWEADDAWLAKMALNAGGKPPKKLVKPDFIQLPVRPIADACAGLGATERLVNSEKKLASLPLMISSGNWLIPSMGFRIFLDLQGMKNEPLVLKKGKQIIIRHRKINIDRYGGAMVDITSPGSAYPLHSFSAVLSGKVSPSRFKNAIVIVGLADSSTDITTATGPKNPLELIGDQISTLYGFMSDKEE